MTDAKQPDALRLADEADTADLAGYPTANAYCLCLLEDCAQMIRRLHAENEALRTGYAAARLEIESLRDEVQEYRHAAGVQKTLIETLLAEKPAGAQQPGAAYAALHDVDSLAQEIRRVDGAHRLGAGALAEALMPFLRASHGQAPAQAAPAAVAGPSDLRTRCEEILAWRKTGVLPGEALRTLASEKYGDEYDAIQRAERDTETEALNFVIAAPTTQPAPQQEAQEPVKLSDEQIKAHGDKASRMMARDLTRFDAACEVDKYLREQGAPGYYRHRMSIVLFGNVEGTEAARAPDTEPQSSPAAQGDALDAEVPRDAERYRFIRDVPYSDDVRSVLVHQQNAAMDRVIDAARAAQEGKSHE